MVQDKSCICKKRDLKKILSGGGRKPALGNIEYLPIKLFRLG